MTPTVTDPPIMAPVPTQHFPRPSYLVYDRVERRWWRPTYESWAGRLEDLSLTASGDLMMRTMCAPAIHESVFPDRFHVVPKLENYTPSLN